ncbi:hypothetical protein I316_06755 [Kwoniella heveanensis BCC8398]|uniref:Inhibitor of growth protein N-terminal histone-binding domain-containing protein n=1 Tax=Kwoniella heveanensis BCC8398 TaxID=1296120 RepID=A0A1B9GKK7_9TREE|nr:hypothetical protein I316_06755 [Kwoniella heveanensis BCC8398]
MPPRKSLPSAAAAAAAATPGRSSTPRGRPSTSTLASASASRSAPTPGRLVHSGKRARTSRGGAQALGGTSSPGFGDELAIASLESPKTKQVSTRTASSTAHHQPANGIKEDEVRAATAEADEEDGAQVVVGIDPEAELEAWQDFAHEHYEMVEQLPLELHRNFRLLRELDDGCNAQIDRLQGFVRLYAKERLDLEKPPSPKPVKVTPEPQTSPGIDPHEQTKGSSDDKSGGQGEARAAVTKIAEVQAAAEGSSKNASQTQEDGNTDDKNEAEDQELVEGRQQVPGVPLPDGQSGLFIHVNPAEPDNAPPNEAKEPVQTQKPEPRKEGNPEAQAQDQAQAQGQASQLAEQPGTSSSTAQEKRKRGDGPHKHLPEIARLAREVVRTAEEKVAVAVGAYNAIDRHIRALDSALTAQEASILLGLRPSTLPSANVDDALNLAGDLANAANLDLRGALSKSAQPGLNAEEGDEEMVLGLGGGGARRSNKRKKNGKKGKKAALEDEAQVRQLELEAQRAQGMLDIPSDPYP